MFQALESFLPGELLHLSHVAGHAGEGWNEMCDWLATEERRKSFLFPRPSLDMSIWKMAMPHLWMLLSTNDGLPPRHGQGLWVPPPALPAVLEDAAVSDEACHQVYDQVSLNVSFCTANVNSLHRAPDGHAGKVKYLRHQFKQLCLLFLGLQETRSPEFTSCVDGVLRLAGGCSGHQHGVELWVNLSQPYAHVGGAPVYFHREDFRVVVKSPRILLVRGDSAYWNGWILVGYAPHSGLSLDVKEAFWNDMKAAVAPCGPGDHIFALMDANASPGESDGVCVFREGLASSSSTRFLREFLATHELCLPCTSAAHVGTMTSWVSPDGQSDHCIDFVAIPRTLLGQCTLSQAVPEFDLGHGDWDHIAMCVELSWDETHLRRTSQQDSMKPFDPSSINQDKVKKILQDYQPMDWCADVESHVQQFNQHVMDGLSLHCPRDRGRPKKQYIDPKTWELRRMKLKLKKKLQGLRIRSRDETKIVFFKAWKDVIQPTTEPLEADRVWAYAHFLLCHSLRLVADLRRTALQLKMFLKNAKKNEIKEVFETMDPRASASHMLHSIKPILGPTNLKKLKSGTLPFLKKSNGEPCTLPNEALEEWIGFFQNMEGGVRMPYSQQHALWRDNLEKLRQDTLQLPVCDLPRLSDLEAALRRINPAKATGPDLIHPSFCRVAPHCLARKIFCQLMKVLTHGQEFLGHKGGFLQPLWKGKGPIDDPASFRSILISSHIGKALHRTIRESQCSIFETFLQTEQIGGRKKVPVNLGVHMSRAFLRAHKAAGDSVGMIYLDLKEAFYRIVRQLAIGGVASDALLAKACARFGLPEGVLYDLHCHLSQPAALYEAGLPQHASNAVKALHEDTFFKVKGQRDCCRTELGTRPGDCYADVIFSYIWCRILKLLQGELQRLDLGEEICTDEGIHICADRALPSGEPRPFLGPTWMDDTCICVSSCTASGVESKTIHAAGLLLQFCEQHALTPNLQKGKTEVLFAFQGNDSRRLKKKYFGPQSDQCVHILAEHGLKKIQVVSKYAHLGCMMHHKSDNRHEARKRLAIAQQTFTQHQRYLLRNPQLSLKRRRELFHSLVMSRLCYGAESWTLSDQRTKDYVHGALLRLFRRLLFSPPDQHMTDDQVLSATGLNSPSEVLRLARLRYVGTLFQCQGVVPWGLLNADQAWLLLIEDDIRWMWTQLRESCNLPDPDVNFQAWQNIIQHHRSYWRRLVRRAGEHACRQRRNQQLVCAFHCQFIDTLSDVKAGLAETATEMSHEHVADTPVIHACMACKSRFRSKGGLGAHNFKRHHQVSPVRLLFDTTCCGACLKEYHTTNKLKSHLLRSSLCRRTLLGQRLRVEPIPGAGSFDDMARSRDHDGLLPPLQGEGPVLPNGRMVDLSPYDLELMEAIYLNIVENESGMSSEEVVRMVIDNHATSWTKCCATLKQMQEELTNDDIEILAEHRRELPAVLERLQQPEAWPFLQDIVRAKSCTLHGVEHYEAVFEHHVQDHHDPIWPIPRPMGRERFIIHAFSGSVGQGMCSFSWMVCKHNQTARASLRYLLT